MTEYPTVEEWNQARKEGKIYCKRINGCNVHYCCWFCTGVRDGCAKKCPRDYWQVCQERIEWKELTWEIILGGHEE